MRSQSATPLEILVVVFSRHRLKGLSCFWEVQLELACFPNACGRDSDSDGVAGAKPGCLEWLQCPDACVGTCLRFFAATQWQRSRTCDHLSPPEGDNAAQRFLVPQIPRRSASNCTIWLSSTNRFTSGP